LPEAREATRNDKKYKTDIQPNYYSQVAIPINFTLMYRKYDHDNDEDDKFQSSL